MSAGVLFYGDPHAIWQPLECAVATTPPPAVVLLGDMELDESLDQKLAPLLDRRVELYWIAGNHDTESAVWYERLFHAGRSLDAGNLHGRIAEIGGLRIAGLGGVFRKTVWDPQISTTATAHTRAEFIARISKARPSRNDMPLRHQVSIFPEDLDALRAAADDGLADVLVCHEAPSVHPKGFSAIDALARDIGANWIVHGHHHQSYEDATPDGVRVRGLGLAEPWRFPEVW